MANSTYLELVNKVCRQINEVELSASNFEDAKGIYNAIKDGVKFAINQINSIHYTWPFNYIEGTSQVLTVGDPFYDFPADYKVADWTSFYIVRNTSLGISTTVLKKVNQDEFHLYYKEQDFDNATAGRNHPSVVFPWGNNAFGVSPVPNQAYTVKYNYFKVPSQLSAYTDETNIPVEYDHVITLGAMWYLNLFRENLEGTKLTEMKFKDELAKMRSVLINKNEDMFSTMTNYGYSRRYVNSLKIL